jgi:hypothetical protein
MKRLQKVRLSIINAQVISLKQFVVSQTLCIFVEAIIVRTPLEKGQQLHRAFSREGECPTIFLSDVPGILFTHPRKGLPTIGGNPLMIVGKVGF